MPNINIEIDEELHKTAKMNCLLLDKSLKEYVITAIKQKLADEKKK